MSSIIEVICVLCNKVLFNLVSVINAVIHYETNPFLPNVVTRHYLTYRNTSFIILNLVQVLLLTQTLSVSPYFSVDSTSVLYLF